MGVSSMAVCVIVCLFLLYEDRLSVERHNALDSDRDGRIRKLGRRKLFQARKSDVTNKGLVLAESTYSDKVKEEDEDESLSISGCDIFSGRWVHDDSYPLYPSEQCPYLSPQFNCKNNGRPDSDYLKWRWQPQDCAIPKFNANEMLEMLRGKKMMFVGDSLSRNQWESMVCMLQAVIPEAEKSAALEYPLSTFTALSYNATVEFFWAPFLVDLDNAYVGSDVKRILRIDSIQNNADYWRGVDILVFNSGHWWTHTGSLKAWDYIESGNNLYEDMDPVLAYANAMLTWAYWIDLNINPINTQVIFTSISPSHFGDMCYKDTEPIQQEESDTETDITSPFSQQMRVVEGILPKMIVHIGYLNITGLSDYRRDAHPSIYSNLSAAQRSDPERYEDCSHWCVSGVPDIWNELLFSMLPGY